MDLSGSGSIHHHPATRLQDNKEAQQKFQEISTAYDTLRDPQKRSLYDRVGPEGMEEGAGMGGGMGGFGVSRVARTQLAKAAQAVMQLETAVATCRTQHHGLLGKWRPRRALLL